MSLGDQARRYLGLHNAREQHFKHCAQIAETNITGGVGGSLPRSAFFKYCARSHPGLRKKRLEHSSGLLGDLLSAVEAVRNLDTPAADFAGEQTKAHEEIR